MTVRELIAELAKLKNKELPVYVRDDEEGLDFPDVSECVLGLDDEDLECVVLLPKHGAEFSLTPPFETE